MWIIVIVTLKYHVHKPIDLINSYRYAFRAGMQEFDFRKGEDICLFFIVSISAQGCTQI
jgi:hypothetical protein